LNKSLNKCQFCKCEAEELRTVDPLGYQVLCINKNCGAKTEIWNEYEDAVNSWNYGKATRDRKLCEGVDIKQYIGDPPPPRYEKPPLGVMPKYIWLEHRARELADYICRLLDVPDPDVDAAAEVTTELRDVLFERKKRLG